MTNFKATIYRQDGGELLKDIVVKIQEVGGNIQSWEGSFEIGDKHIELGQYRIKLEDGRGGDIVINKMSAGSSGETRMRFQGSGARS